MKPAMATPFASASLALSRILDVVVAALLAAVVAIVLTQVVTRYVFNFSLIWSGELVRLLHVWMILLAAVQARHMRITIVTDLLPKPLRRALDWAASGIALACLGVLVWGSWRIADLLWSDSFTRLPLSPALLFVAVVAGGAMWAVVLTTRTWRDVDDPSLPDHDPKAPPGP